MIVLQKLHSTQRGQHHLCSILPLTAANLDNYFHLALSKLTAFLTAGTGPIPITLGSTPA